ncbi:hypothetical protein HY087_02705 [Candidatus Gottesmanbacteria bacterium]|nr:hypothetical protein [Candidatus Gottesmanbacteria bacterium]
MVLPGNTEVKAMREAGFLVAILLRIDLVVGADVQKFSFIVTRTAVGDAYVAGDGKRAEAFLTALECMISKERVAGIVHKYLDPVSCFLH